MPGVLELAAAQLLAALGAGAILFGSVVALRQERLKLLIAYSTLAQIGYLFLMFPLAFGAGSAQLAERPAPGRAACCRRFPMPPPRPRCSWPAGRSTRRSAMIASPNSRHRPGAAHERPGFRDRRHWR